MINGTQSPAFKAAIRTACARLDDAVREAELETAGREVAELEKGSGAAAKGLSGSAPPYSGDGEEEESREGDEPGLIEAQECFAAACEDVARLGAEIGELITSLGQLFENATPSAGFASRDAVILSRQVDPISKKINAKAGAFRDAMESADVALRSAAMAAAYAGMGDEFSHEIQVALEKSGSVTEEAASLQGLLDAMRVPEAMSTALRRSLRPARAGFTALVDAAGLYDQWREISAVIAEPMPSALSSAE
ncbi:hypothetical protein [Dermacoccus sp. GAS27A]|uniref:hypothetical protein n=1 Tax=Dermacoccus sp. GAS27A TaxID=3156270 RepID=UPI00383709B4